jgi:hypothetical protein
MKQNLVAFTMISAASLNKVSLSEISISRLMPLSSPTNSGSKPLHMLLRTYKISYFFYFGVNKGTLYLERHHYHWCSISLFLSIDRHLEYPEF